MLITRKSRLVKHLTPFQVKALGEFNHKVDHGDYLLEEQPCVCGNPNGELISNIDRYGIRINTIYCDECGVVRTDPYYTEDTLRRFYNEDYRQIYSGVPQCDEDFFAVQYESAREIYDFISPNIQGQKTCLEVGCGAGGILQFFKEKGMDIYGIDIGKQYIEYGASQGLTLEYVDLDDFITRGKKFDLIILNHVIEHIKKPIEFVQKLESLMSENGLLYLGCPGVRSIRTDYGCDTLSYLQNAHVYGFTLKTLRRVTSPNGLKMIDGNEKVQALFEKGSEMQECTDQDSINCLRWNEKLLPFYRVYLGLRMKLFKY